jgi:uncharacterized protein (TIGR00369 family)
MTDEHAPSPGCIPPPAPIPYIESLGAELLEMADGKAVAVMTPTREHMNSWDVVHGGVLMTLLDFAMAMAGRSAWRPASPTDEGRNLTVEMKTTFMRPGRGRLTITGRCLQAGRTLSFCEGEITDAEGTLVTRASGTFKFWSKK